jgi:competence protein ComEC
VSYPKILILKSHQLNPVKEFLLQIKEAFTKRLSGLFYEPQNSLLVGILIGGHGTLPKTVVDNFNNTGVSHIIAVSGFNITIIISALASLAYVVGRRASFWLATSTIIAFVIITGASASVVRAAIMGFLLLIALSIGRQYSIGPALFFAGLIMLIINPKILFWDVGFQLSFAATLGIIYFMPVLNQLTEKLPQAFGVKTLILTTLSAIAATLPIILFNFGTLSFSAPLVNLLILPFVPATMLFGFLSILPFVGPGFALVANWLLIYILKVTDFFAHVPYSSLNIQISVWIFWLLNAAVFGVYFGLRLLSNKSSRQV